MKKDSKKKPKVNIGVAEAKLGSLINEQLGYPCVCNSLVGEMMRGLRLHSPRFLKQLEESDMAKAQLGLAHSYSRAKVSFCLQIPGVTYLEPYLTYWKDVAQPMIC